jgi:hypothetical protein
MYIKDREKNAKRFHVKFCKIREKNAYHSDQEKGIWFLFLVTAMGLVENIAPLLSPWELNGWRIS